MDRPTKELVDVCLKHASADTFKVKFTAVDNYGAEYEASANLAPVLAAEVRALREELALARAKNPPWYNDVTALVKAARALIAERDNVYTANYEDQIEGVREALKAFDTER